MKKIKVLFLITDLGGGGAERVLVNLVNNMNKNHFDITVQTIFPAGVNKCSISDGVRLIEGNIHKIKGVSRLFKLLPKSILYTIMDKSEYDIAIAFMHGAPTKVLWKHKGKKIAWLHCDMNNSSLPLFFYKPQIKKCFATYDRIVGVSNSVCDSFAKLYGLREKLLTVYNTNDTLSIIRQSQVEDYYQFDWSNYSGIKLITLGRLEKQKGYDRLINVCNRLNNNGLSFKLLILGQGSQRDNLNNQIRDYKLNDFIELGGYIPNPYPYIKQADLFVCSSRYEGLSTVMSETLILGTPIITTDVSGAKEVLGNSEYGLIVKNNEDSLYYGLKELLQHPDRITHYKIKAKQRAPFFDTVNTVASVESLIEEVVNE